MMRKALLTLAVAMGGFTTAQAADTSVTVVTDKYIQPVGKSPMVGYVEMTSLESGSDVFTFDLPVPNGMDVVGFIPSTYASNSIPKPLQATLSGITVTVQGTDAASGTLAVGDIVKGVVIYE